MYMYLYVCMCDYISLCEVYAVYMYACVFVCLYVHDVSLSPCYMFYVCHMCMCCVYLICCVCVCIWYVYVCVVVHTFSFISLGFIQFPSTKTPNVQQILNFDNCTIVM